MDETAEGGTRANTYDASIANTASTDQTTQITTDRMRNDSTTATETPKKCAAEAPLFWTQHDRTISSVSYQSIGSDRPAPITLEDHSEEHDVQTQGCWAKGVIIDDYVIISGPTGIGAYVVWNCTVETLKGGNMSIRKR